jgi:hypothetical protein
MDDSGTKSSVGWHLKVRRRSEDLRNGLWRWWSGLWSLL